MPQQTYAISVVIPTYNRADTLRLTLEAYRDQSVRSDAFEIIVVDDGSSDHTQDLLKSLAPALPYHLRVHVQKNQGPGAARNWAIGVAASPIIFITGDDIIPHEDLLWEHLLYHAQHRNITDAMVGKVDWDPNIPLSFLMHFITEVTDYQFGFHRIKDPENVSPGFFYTSNISLKTEMLRSSPGFDPAFIYAAFEDIELGVRLQKLGMHLRYRKNAIGFHHHRITLDSFCERQYKAGQMQVVFNRLQGSAVMKNHHQLLEVFESERKNTVESLLSLVKRSQEMRIDAIVDGPFHSVPKESNEFLCQLVSTHLDGYRRLGEIDYSLKILSELIAKSDLRSG
jgi:glycosyltransferase involved in cell wall biosynthesis